MKSSRVAAALFAAAALGMAPASPARAEDPPSQASSVSIATRYQVTFVARTCTSYAQVMANRVRDDTTEAATAPGRDNQYDEGEGVNPDVEAANGNGCTALNGWHFTIGAGAQRRGALSSVTGPTQDVGPTGSTTPLLNAAGAPTGKTIDGAVTVALTDDQVKRAVNRQLWVQGGTPDGTDPTYGFGALRCGYDGRAGTNVQWIGFPAEIRHVFCFVYYVQSAAPAGTLIVRTKPTRAVGYPQRFTYDATNSYTADKRLTVATAGNPADVSLVRTAGGLPSRVTAHPPAGWRLSDLSCSKSGAGQSLTATDPIQGTADVTLAPGEVVTCTFTFDPPVVVTGLAARVFSDLAGGTFGVTINGDGGPRQLQAAPAGDGSAADATGADLSTLTPGQYTISVAPPAGQGTLWSLATVTCNGDDVKPNGLVATVQLAISTPLDCVLRMARRPATLDLSAVTVGGTGTAAFAVVRRPDGAGSSPDNAVIASGSTATGVGWSAAATTTAFGTAADAQGNLPGALDYGSYLVTPLAPPSTVDGAWRLSSFSCDPGDPAASGAAGANVVPLRLDAPDAKCVATFQFVPATKLQVTLRFDGDTTGRSAAASLTVKCDDGSSGAIILPTDDNTDRSLPQPLGFLAPTTCTVNRPDDGAAVTTTATTTAVLDPAPGNAPLSLPGRVDIKRDVDEYLVTVTITYAANQDTSRQATVLNTFRILPVALIGAGLVGLGLVILLVMVVRSRGV
jgi:hypothetical protein